jgi:hypothetical protein
VRPTQPVYATTGRTGEVKAGKNTIRFRHVAPRKMQYAGTPVGTAITALRYLGKEQVTPQVIATLEQDLCLRVVNHKDAFWRDGKAKYDDCRNKKFRLVPTGDALAVLKADYEAMLEAGMFFSEKPAPFDDIMHDISSLQSRLNSKIA